MYAICWTGRSVDSFADNKTAIAGYPSAYVVIERVNVVVGTAVADSCFVVCTAASCDIQSIRHHPQPVFRFRFAVLHEYIIILPVLRYL